MNTEHLPSGERASAMFQRLVTNAFPAIGCRLSVLSRNARLRKSGFYCRQSVEIERLVSQSSSRVAAVDQRGGLDQVPAVPDWPGTSVYGGVILHDFSRCR